MATTTAAASSPANSNKVSLDGQAENQHQAQQRLESSGSPSLPSSWSEFDPCANAKITSPFYLYNHDSPGDYLEAQQIDEDLTSSITGTTLEKRSSSESGKARLWARRNRQSQCLTKKRVSRWKSLPAWQRLLIKLLIGLLLTGMVVGVAVGVSLRVNGGVYKNSNQSTNIH
ncbi:hypothetical protein DV736_g3658, partial [Chaetothyriales sp. CBS 134916]